MLLTSLIPLMCAVFNCAAGYWVLDGSTYVWITDPVPNGICSNGCPVGNLCHEPSSKCWPKIDIRFNCNVFNSCPRPDIYTCVVGRCECLACRKDDVPTPVPLRRSCGFQFDCPNGYSCVLNQCWPTTQTGFTCSHSRPCPKSNIYECISGKCQIADQIFKPIANILSFVFGTTHGESTVDPLFNKNENRILADLYPATCKRTSECSKFRMCRNNQCWPSNQRVAGVNHCKQDSDCLEPRSLYKCIQNQCKIPATPTPRINKQSNVTPLPGVSCDSFTVTHCGPGFACRSNQCWPRKINNVTCTSDSQCQRPDIYKCIKFYCRIP